MRASILILGFCAAACGSKASPADTAVVDDAVLGSDTSGLADLGLRSGDDIGVGVVCGENWKQGYCIKFTFHGQKFDGRTFTVQRDLTGTSSTVVFGDTHMQPPAVSLAIHDTWQLGTYKDPLDLNIVLGNLVNAPGFPPFVPKAADYPFSCTPPYLDFSYGNIRYRSTCPDLAGDINVKKWSATPGGQVSGRFSGHLQQFLGANDDCKDATVVAAACKSALNTVDVEGTFGVTLPALNSDLAP